MQPYKQKSSPNCFGEDLAKQPVNYGVADAAGEGTLIVVLVSVLFVLSGDGFTIVVLLSFFS